MEITRVGIGVVVFRGSKILLGKRKGSHGSGEWGLPGGAMEYMESFQACAERELVEEVGPQFKVAELCAFSVINLTEYAPKHYIDIGMYAEWVSGEPELMEPTKCEAWEWFDVFNLPYPLFAPVSRVLGAYFGKNSAFMDVSN